MKRSESLRTLSYMHPAFHRNLLFRSKRERVKRNMKVPFTDEYGTDALIVYVDAPVAIRASTAKMIMYLQSSSRRNKSEFPKFSAILYRVLWVF